MKCDAISPQYAAISSLRPVASSCEHDDINYINYIKHIFLLKIGENVIFVFGLI